MAHEAIEAGRPAPAFTLPNQDDKPVSLDALQGQWVVLYFYPRDDTPGCTTEACEFTDRLSSFQKLDAKVFGVSPDSPASHRSFMQKHGLRIELLSDPKRQVLQRYGAWGKKISYGKESEGVIRSTVLIDPQGKVAFHWPTVKAPGHAQAVAEKLAELRGT